MNFNFIDQNTETDFNKIIKVIQAHKNGVVSDQLKNSGLNYEMIWGVSIPHLRKIAATFNTNDGLALLLWNKGWRETMILATMLADADEMNDDQLDQWLSDVDNLELAEQFGFNLLSNRHRSPEVWLSLIQNKKDFQRLSVLKGLYRIVLKKDMDESSVTQLFEEMQELSLETNSGVLEITSFGQLYACMGRRYPDLIKPILAFIYKFVKAYPLWEALVGIVENEFEWLNET